MTSMLHDIWQALGEQSDIVIALVATAGVYLTARPALADIGLKRRLETAQRFAELVQTTNKGTDFGVMGQVSSIWLIASFGRDERHLREPARATLKAVQSAFPEGSKVTEAATEALEMLPSRRRPW